MSREKAIELLKGGTVIPAIPLALNDDGTFNEHGQRVLCRYYPDAGVCGPIEQATAEAEITKSLNADLTEEARMLHTLLLQVFRQYAV